MALGKWACSKGKGTKGKLAKGFGKAKTPARSPALFVRAASGAMVPQTPPPQLKEDGSSQLARRARPSSAASAGAPLNLDVTEIVTDTQKLHQRARELDILAIGLRSMAREATQGRTPTSGTVHTHNVAFKKATPKPKPKATLRPAGWVP